MKNSIKGFSIGGVTIISIFVILSLSMFGVLSVTSTQSNVRLSVKYAENTADYYNANARIQEQLFEINEDVKEFGFTKINNTIVEQINDFLSITITWSLDDEFNIVIDEYKTVLNDSIEYDIFQEEFWDGTIIEE